MSQQQKLDLFKIGLEWGYEGDYDPSNWCAKYPHASGTAQSPIDIQTNDAVYNEDLVKNPLTFSYDQDNFLTILNTGSSFKISGSENANSSVIGGPVQDIHKFLQFHMHWGKDDTIGSEHLIDGKSYAGELHFVNWNTQKYSSGGEAASSNNHDGLIVLGVMVQVGAHNTEFDKILNNFDEISLRDKKTKLKESLDVKKLFPNDTSSYWNYDGSLTTPPCTQCVQWVVFKEPIEISIEQLNRLRDLYQCKEESDCCDAYRLNQNFRPVCDLNGRKISKSFN
ncbi:unnamed protein product [Brachionus calyciflorus]|uniref:Carbonic anhydrase n=1 Tax=Brachionus calyciflorus TaxID=104777 RepID=A0A813PB27_9BILA|nr:unnamed protein product [Brachionus calyciflorus]